MSLYSAHHWRSDGVIKIGEYWPVLEPTHKKISYKRDLIIELFEHKNFNGKVIRIFGERYSKLTDFKKVFVEGESFNDKVSSLRMILPEGYKFVLYHDQKFKGEPLPFPGNGHYQDWSEFVDVNDKFSSCRIEKLED